MTSCSEFQNRWSHWRAGGLDKTASQLLWQHAQSCPRCAAYHRQMQFMLNALNSLPAPGAVPDGLADRLLRNARTAQPVQTGGARTKRRLSIAAAVLIVVLGTALLNPFQPLLDKQAESDTPQVALSLERTRQVHLVFEAESNVENVEYTIELPDGVEVHGYPGLKVLRWSGELQAGRNGLTLPLVGRQAGSNGLLKARIRYRDAQRELSVPVHTPEQPGGGSAGNFHSSKQTTTSANQYGSGGVSI